MFGRAGLLGKVFIMARLECKTTHLLAEKVRDSNVYLDRPKNPNYFTRISNSFYGYIFPGPIPSPTISPF